jgi:hypothetical protein
MLLQTAPPIEPKMFKEFDNMILQLNKKWADGVPGSSSPATIQLTLMNATKDLHSKGIIGSTDALNADELHHVWKYANDQLLGRRRYVMRDRWYQPAVHFVCHDNSGLSQAAGAYLKYLSSDQIWVSSSSPSPSKELKPLAVKALRNVDEEFAWNAEDEVVYSRELPKPTHPSILSAVDMVIRIGNDAPVVDKYEHVQQVHWSDVALPGEGEGEGTDEKVLKDLIEKIKAVCVEFEIPPRAHTDRGLIEGHSNGTSKN